MTDHLLIRSFSKAIYKSKLSVEQTMILAHLAAHPDPADRSARSIGSHLDMNDGNVGKKLKDLNQHDFVDKPPGYHPFYANKHGLEHLKEIAAAIKAALGIKPKSDSEP